MECIILWLTYARLLLRRTINMHNPRFWERKKMTKTLSELQEEAAMLRKHLQEFNERKALEEEIKRLREVGSLKEKGFKLMKNIREKLHTKGEKFREEAKQQEKNSSAFGNNTKELIEQSNFGTPKEMLKQEIKTELYKELTKNKKVKK